MSDFRTIAGFEEVWRPPVHPRMRRPETVLQPGRGDDVRARLRRVAARTPEVMVKVTGRTRDPAHLTAHLTYITRNGQLAAEGRDGLSIEGREEVLDVARAWAAEAMLDSRRRVNTPMSVAIILSMPAGTDSIRLRDAARAFASETFEDRFEYVLALHTDTAHPHAHLTVNALGAGGERLNPRKADLESWRQTFARCLRERGIAAEATPRRARGVTRKGERGAMRRLRERHEQGQGALGRVAAEKVRDAAQWAFGRRAGAGDWDRRIVERQARVRQTYLAQAKLLETSERADDRELGRSVEAFVRSMAPPDTERLALARALRVANERARADQERGAGQGRSR